MARGDAQRQMTVRAADSRDHDAVVDLLETAGLPLAGIARSLSGFVVAEDGGRVLGAICLEVYGPDGLLRSAVVHPTARGTGIGVALVGRILDHANVQGTRGVYLLTTTAEGYFQRLGFDRVNREEVPEAVKASLEFREACPASATVMRKVLEQG